MSNLLRRRHMMGNQSGPEYIQFADPNVEAICVANWSSDGVGLTYRDAAAVTDIGTVFQGNPDIVLFDEFEYFTGVTSLSYGAFMNCSALTSIAIPPQITRSPQALFSNCSSLSCIKFNAPFGMVAAGAFNGCTSLARVDVPSLDVWLNMGRWEGYPFIAHGIGDVYVDGQKLTHLVLPDNISSIPTWCFGFTSIESFNIPPSLIVINANAFNRSGLKGTVVIPDGITLGATAFGRCSELTNLYIYNSATISYNDIQNYNSYELGDGSGVFYYAGNIVNGTVYANRPMEFKHMLVGGNFLPRLTGSYTITSTCMESFRCKGDFETNTSFFSLPMTSTMKFFEVGGTIISTSTNIFPYNPSDVIITHLGYNGVACTGNIADILANTSTKVYVGDGSSVSSDQSVLSQYLTDPNWSQYPSKLDIWSNYSGVYKEWPPLKRPTPIPLHPFSVSATDQIYFSPGNLQYQASTKTWRFAENQWDRVGNDVAGNVYVHGTRCSNTLISSTYDGWIDLFGWGTSGYHNPDDEYNLFYQPYDTSNTQTGTQTDNYYGYGPSSSFITTAPDKGLIGQNANYDWGVYNPIYDPNTHTIDAAGTWRTPLQTELTYICNTRVTTSGIRYAKGTINEVVGLILFPDDWDSNIAPVNSPNTGNAAYTTNIISGQDWIDTYEANGCIFMPEAFSRAGTSVQFATRGYYWCADCSRSWETAYSNYFLIYSGTIGPYGGHRRDGYSVRLVRNV